jgi:hypothetical protein
MSLKMLGDIKALQALFEDIIPRLEAVENELQRQKGGRPRKQENENGERAKTD